MNDVITCRTFGDGISVLSLYHFF